MARIVKSPLQKFQTRLTHLTQKDTGLTIVKRRLRVNNQTLLSYTNQIIKYTNIRYYPSKVQNIVNEDFGVSIPLMPENLNILSSNISKPPQGAKIVINIYRKLLGIDFDHITIGDTVNRINDRSVSIKKELYDRILSINKEESVDKKIRVNNRTIPFLNKELELTLSPTGEPRDYHLLLQEIIASGQITQQDVLNLSNDLVAGNNTNILIQRQVIKQVEWLVDKMQEIVDQENLTKVLARKLGNEIFGFLKGEINGPEHLMEKILSKYGKYTIFGVPAMINTDKYVINKDGLPRSQFDLILVNHLSDIEVVELKRPDIRVLEYDESRGKFYASKELSIAVSQAERYVSAVYHDHDENYLISGKKIKEYLNDQLGGTMTVEICRPKALIILSSYQKISTVYEDTSENVRQSVTKDAFDYNKLQAFKEIKEAYKNIRIMTYSELLDNARTRLITLDS